MIRDGQAPVLMGDCSAHPDLVQAYLWAVDGAATLLLLERFESLFPGTVLTHPSGLHHGGGIFRGRAGAAP